MKKLWILFTLFLLGCSPASISTPTLVPITSTKISTSTSILTPTVTPYPALQIDGPYLLFTRDEKDFTIIDADGVGRKQFQLPNDGYILGARQSSFQNAFSPDGKWLAYFTGKLIEPPYDLTLNLFNIENGTTFQVTRILAPDYPKNLLNVKTAEPNENYSCNNEDCIIGVVQLAFMQGIESLDWSPDSKSLAFAAQIDDPSSDVYIFDLDTKSIRRLVADNENVWLIDWSPNGEKILFQNSLADQDYIPISIHIADPNIKNPQSPNALYSGRFLYQYGWINENSWLISSGGEGAPAHNFRLINIFTQEIKTIWQYEAEKLTVDYENNRIILSTPEDSENQPKGTFLVKDSGSYQKLSDNLFDIFEDQNSSEIYFGLEKLSKTSRADNFQLLSISINSSISEIPTRVPLYYAQPRLSPDENWILVYSTKGIELYSNHLELIKMWDNLREIEEITWRPDSLGAYLIKRDSIYYFDIETKEIKTISLCEDCSFRDYVWIP